MSSWHQTFGASLVVGVAVAAPVGPVGVLCVQRTLRGGVALGVASGLGVATADGLYAALAALGLTALTALIDGLSVPLRVAGGAVMLMLAWRAWRSSSEVCGAAPATSVASLFGAYASTLALTLANPATILSFAAIMAGLGGGVADPAAGPPFVAGVASGSLLWWVFLALAIGAIRTRAPEPFVHAATRVSALVLGAAGLATVASVVLSVLPGR